MSCNCKHEREAIERFYKTISEFREMFIKRMTVDSETTDRRRKDYNQAIFSWWSDENVKTPENTFPVWSEMSMAMVLECFDNAVKDYRRSFCDVENCTRK